MTRYRQYEPEPLSGVPAPFAPAKQRKALIGRRIEWNVRGWIGKRSGTIEAVEGKNVLVSGDWKWAAGMLNVHVLPEDEA